MALGGFNPSNAPGMVAYWLGDDQGSSISNTITRTGGTTLTFSGSTVTVSGLATIPGVSADYQNMCVTITGQSPGNNGTFTQVNRPSSTQVQFRNFGSPVAEPFVGTLVLHGKLNTLTERVAGKTFAPTHAVNYWWSRNPNVPGAIGKNVFTTVAATTPNRSCYTRTDAPLVAPFNGGVNFTWGGYYYLPNADWEVATDLQSLTTGAFTAGDSYIRLGMQAATNNRLIVSHLGETDTLTRASTVPPQDTWTLVLMTYDYSTRTAEWFFDGVSLGTVTDVTGAAPVPTDMDVMNFGETANSTTAREVYAYNQLFATGKWSSSLQVQMLDWLEAKRLAA
jgi:hypothetical protein